MQTQEDSQSPPGLGASAWPALAMANLPLLRACLRRSAWDPASHHGSVCLWHAQRVWLGLPSGTGRVAPVLLRHCGGQEAHCARDHRRRHRRPRQAPAAALDPAPHDVPPIGHHVRLQHRPATLRRHTNAWDAWLPGARSASLLLLQAMLIGSLSAAMLATCLGAPTEHWRKKGQHCGMDPDPL